MAEEHSAEKDAGRITPIALRHAAQLRTVDGYVYVATVRDLMRRLADHMEAMAPYEQPLGPQKPPPPGPGATSRMVTEVAITRDLPPRVQP